MGVAVPFPHWLLSLLTVSLFVFAVVYGILSYSPLPKLPHLRTMLQHSVDMAVSGSYRMRVVIYVTDPEPLAGERPLLSSLHVVLLC